MPQDKVKKIHLIYGCIATVLIVALGILLMVSAWQIYQSGSHPYTRASIGEKLQQMSVLIYLAAAVIAGGFVLNIVLPLEKKKPAAIRDELTIMKKLAARAGTPSYEENSAIEKERKLQKLVPVITAVIYAAMLIWPAIYMFNSANFPGADPTAEIMNASVIVLPFCLAGLALCYICNAILSASIRRQTAIYKQNIAKKKEQTVSAPHDNVASADLCLQAEKNGQVPAAPSKAKKSVPIGVIRFAVLVIAIALIVAGIFNGSAKDVLTKAIKICTECIGLG